MRGIKLADFFIKGLGFVLAVELWCSTLVQPDRPLPRPLLLFTGRMVGHQRS